MHYDICCEPWIPIRYLDGRHGQVGLRELLVQANEIQAIVHASPLVEYSIYRFVLLFLTDALRPQDDEKLEEYAEEAAFPMQAIDDYIALCRAEGVTFDLFDHERPFLQTAGMDTWGKKIKSIGELDCTLPTGNNHIHFDHKTQEKHRLTPAEAVGGLLASQIFCTSGLKGPSNVNGAPPYFILVQGQNLFKTLMANLLPVESIDTNTQRDFDNPPPVWRSATSIVPWEKVQETSWCFGMLFPARALSLCPPDDDGLLHRMYYEPGLDYAGYAAWNDPHVAYVFDKKEVRGSLKPNFSKRIWRNLAALVESQKGAMCCQAPQVVQHCLLRQADENYLLLRVYGAQTNQASYENAMVSDVQIPMVLAHSQIHIATLKHAINKAELVRVYLHQAIKAAKDDSQSLAHMDMLYFSRCEDLFWNMLCHALSNESPDFKAVLAQWNQEVSKIAKDVAHEILLSGGLTGRDFCLAAQAESKLSRNLYKLTKEEG